VTAFAAPTVLNGTLFVGSAAGTVQAIDAQRGCSHWIYKAGGPVRSAMTIATEGQRRTLLFSDQNGSVYAVDPAAAMSCGRRVGHEATRLTGAFALHGAWRWPAASWEGPLRRSRLPVLHFTAASPQFAYDDGPGGRSWWIRR
jgi:hypothetical protein